jgi:FeS assembly protein IscX
MPFEYGWEDAEEIGIQLQEKFPDTDPLSVRFTDMHKMITGLPGFNGDPAKSNEGILEAIQMAWLEEYNDAK